ncbi:unnamed protein product [Closterium sp. NIES-53]
MRELNSVKKLGAPCVSQATKAALRSVWQPARLPTAPAGAKNGLTGTRLLLALATTKASKLRSSTSTSTTAAATFTAAAAASTTPTAATEAPTRATTPTSTATPSASSTASTAAPTVPSTTLAPLALDVAVPPTRKLSGKRIAVAGVTSAEVSNEVRDCGKGGKVREKSCTGQIARAQQTAGDYEQQGEQQRHEWSTASELYCEQWQQVQGRHRTCDRKGILPAVATVAAVAAVAAVVAEAAVAARAARAGQCGSVGQRGSAGRHGLVGRHGSAGRCGSAPGGATQRSGAARLGGAGAYQGRVQGRAAAGG